MEITISLIAILISIFTLAIQRYGIKKQDENQRKQSELQALTSLLNAEIHLHNFNNLQSINSDNQKKWAAKNFDEIMRLKNELARRI